MRTRVCGSIMIVLLTALGACAQRADVTTLRTGSAALASVRAAPDVAAEAGSARFEMTLAVSSAEGSYDIVVTGGYSGRQMSMQMNIADVLAARGEPVPPEAAGPMEIVVDGDATYLKLPTLPGGTSGDTWVSIDPSDLGVASSLGLGAGAGPGDPAQLLASLRGMSDDITEVGAEDVRGVATTHLAGTIDPARAIDRVARGEERALLRAQLEALGSLVGGIPVDVWIDAKGLVRRFAIDASGVLQASGGSAEDTVTMTLELFDYGKPFSVTVPDPSSTTSFDALGQMGRS